MNLDKVIGEFMYSQKYRPQKIKDIILPTKIKDQLQHIIKDGRVVSLLLHGEAGVGKTTVAEAIINELNADVLRLNGSGKGKGVDTMRNDVDTFCKTMSLTGNQKIVFIDEADYLTKDAQAALRSMMEEYSKNVAFIFTGNYVNNISDPLRSRFVEIDFSFSESEHKTMQLAMLKRTISILQDEGVIAKEVDDKYKEQVGVVSSVVKTYYPNNRKILNLIQTMVNKYGLSAETLTIINQERYDDLCTYILERKWSKMRTWVTDNQDIPSDNIVSYFFKNGEEKFGIKNMPMIIVNMDDYQKNVGLVKNPIVSTVALFTKIQQSLQVSA